MLEKGWLITTALAGVGLAGREERQEWSNLRGAPLALFLQEHFLVLKAT